MSNIRELLPLSFISLVFLSFSAFIKISDIFFIVKGNGNQFEDIWVFIKSVKAFNCRFYLLCFIFDPANVAFSSTTLFAKPFSRVFLNADTSPIYLYIVIVKYEYKIYLMNFIYFYCTAT